MWAEEAAPPLPLAVGDAVGFTLTNGFSLNPFMMSMRMLREGGVASDWIEEGGGGGGDRAWTRVV